MAIEENDAETDAELATLLDDASATDTQAEATPDAAAPEAPESEVRVVKEGDTLFGIAQEVGVPLQKLAEDNNITDVNVISPGQELKIDKPGGPDTDISAAPTPEGASDDFIDNLTIEGETTTALDAASGGSGPILPNKATEDRRKQELQLADSNVTPSITEDILADSDDGTPVNTTTVNEVGFEDKPAIAEGTDKSVETETIPVVDVTQKILDESELLKIIQSVKPTSTEGADVYDKIIERIGDIEHDNTFDATEFYQKISKEAETETKKIDEQIAEIAEEKIKPTFTGFNKFMAVLGAAMGAYGSAMTGTPNFALQIMNQAIDADAEQFLASKDIRTKSLMQQRQEVLQRRVDLLQIGMNEADKMLKIAELQVKKEGQAANIQAIKDQLQQEKDKTLAEVKLALIENISTKASAAKMLEQAKTKDQRERQIEAVTLKDGEGNLIEMPAFLAKTAKEGAELRKTSGFANQIQDILNKIDGLADKDGKLPLSAMGPKTISETRTKVEGLTKLLIIKLKEFYGMGANFTVYEQSLVESLAPTDSWLEKWKMWKVKSNNLRDIIVGTHKSMAEAQGAGFAEMPNAAGKRKLGPGMKAGVAK